MDEKPEPKFSTPEIIIVFLFLVVIDIIEIILVFFALDDFWILDAIAFPATWLYLTIKGVKANYAIITQAVELIPYVGWIPFRTFGFIAVVYVDRHPKLEAAVGKVAQISGKKMPAKIPAQA